MGIRMKMWKFPSLISTVIFLWLSVTFTMAEVDTDTDKATAEIIQNISDLLNMTNTSSGTPLTGSDNITVEGILASKGSASKRYNVNLETWVAPLDIQKSFTYYLSGFDEDNRPIWVGEVGKWKMREYVDRGGPALRDLEIYFEQAFHRYNKSIELRSTAEDPVTDGVVILDMEDYDVFQLASIPVLRLAIMLAREVVYIARRMERGYFVNTNFIAERFINLLKPILNESLARTEIYGTNKAKWIPRLLKYIPRESLPEWYGGSKDFKPIAVYG